MSVLSEVFRISMGTPTIYKIVEFFQNYRTSKQISTDEENPTTIDEFDGYECGGYRVSTYDSTISAMNPYFTYGSITLGSHSFSNLKVNELQWLEYTYNGETHATFRSGYIPTSALGFGLMFDSFYSNRIDIVGIFVNNDGTVQYMQLMGAYYPCTSPTEVSQSTEASIDLDTWNTNIDWLDELIESGDDTYISIDSDSYEEVSDPEELADTIMDAITDNDYEGTIAESPEPISYATTVKAALDTLYTSLGANDLNLVSVPASASAAGSSGDVAFDDNYLYLCTATNTWTRSALSTWT